MISYFILCVWWFLAITTPQLAEANEQDHSGDTRYLATLSFPENSDYYYEAENSPLTISVIQQLGFPLERCYCSYVKKIALPSDAQKSLLLIPVIVDKPNQAITGQITEDFDLYFELAWYLVLADSDSYKVITSLYESSDATSLGWDYQLEGLAGSKFPFIRIDPVSYQLSSKAVFFGLETINEHGGLNRSRDSKLSIYSIEQDHISKVLDRYMTDDYAAEVDDCDRSPAGLRQTVSVSKESSNSHFNLTIARERYDYYSNLFGCQENDVVQPLEPLTMKYIEGQYRLTP